LFFHYFFGLVMCHESQTWSLMVIEKMYIIYFMHIDFIQSSSSNHWIKFNFESQNVVMHILSFFFLCLGFSKNAIKISACYILIIHHFFGWKVAHPWCAFTFKWNPYFKDLVWKKKGEILSSFLRSVHGCCNFQSKCEWCAHVKKGKKNKGQHKTNDSNFKKNLCI
jgi:hypothetical protein